MKIAVFFELEGGGARRGANEFAKALKLLGNTVDLFCVDTQILEAERGYYTNIFLFPFFPVQWNGHDWWNRLRRDTFELIRIYWLHKQIAKQIENEGYDFVFVQPSRFTQAPFILSCLKIPSVYYCQEPLRLIYDPLFSIPNGLPLEKKFYEFCIRRMRRWIDAANIHRATYVLANSSFTKENIAKAYGIESHVCHMGVDTYRFYPTSKKSIDILFIGSRDFFDGYPLFQESLAYMKIKPKIHYLIRGENWATNDAELRKFYSRARIVACLGFHEPFGLIPLEAMACGAAVIALNEGGYRDSVKDQKTGLLVDRDAKQLAAAFDYLLTHPTLLQKLISNASQEIKKYWTWKRGATEILKTVHKTKNTSAGMRLLFLYIFCTTLVLMFFRLGFRFARNFFLAPTIQAGVVGFAQYYGYPIGFETIYFNLMFLTPVVIACCFAHWYPRRHT